jgi:hypothetical protein
MISLSCVNSKEIDGQKEENLKEEISQASNMEENYIFNIEIVNNLMPSSTPRKFMYAIVSLSPKSGTFENNWKVASFELNGVSYSKFDDTKFNGKGLLIFRNTVREIPYGEESQLSACVILKNDKGQTLIFNADGIVATVVH